MPSMLATGRPGVVARRNRLLPGQRECHGARAYHAGSSWQSLPAADALAARTRTLRRMRSEHDRRRAHTAAWFISAGVMAVSFAVWQRHLRQAEHRAEEAERTRDEAAQRRAM